MYQEQRTRPNPLGGVSMKMRLLSGSIIIAMTAALVVVAGGPTAAASGSHPNNEQQVGCTFQVDSYFEDQAPPADGGRIQAQCLPHHQSLPAGENHATGEKVVQGKALSGRRG
jgi:hypothetical protein